MDKSKYQGVGFSVTWAKEACIHSGVCVKTLPNVFKPGDKPWVKTDKATKAEIAAMIKNCPSKALEYHEES